MLVITYMVISLKWSRLLEFISVQTAEYGFGALEIYFVTIFGSPKVN